jgi:hypothetical protein
LKSPKGRAAFAASNQTRAKSYLYRKDYDTDGKSKDNQTYARKKVPLG